MIGDFKANVRKEKLFNNVIGFYSMITPTEMEWDSLTWNWLKHGDKQH